MENKDYFSKMCNGESSWCHLWAVKSIKLSPAIKSIRSCPPGSSHPSIGEGDTFANRNLCSAFRQIEGEGLRAC